MIIYDELIFCLQQKYLNFVYGVDYWVGQEMCCDINEQLVLVCIIVWYVDGWFIDEEVDVLVEQYGEVVWQYVFGQCVCEECDCCLEQVDVMFYKVMDFGDVI